MSNNKNRRGFLKNIGTAIAGVAATAIVAPQIASASSGTTPNTTSAALVPTFEHCYQKVLRKELLTEIEVIIYSSEMNRLAWESDTPVLSKLHYTCSSEKEFIEQKQIHFESRNSMLHYWAALPHNMNERSAQNLIQVHKYVVNSILQVINGYSTYTQQKCVS